MQKEKTIHAILLKKTFLANDDAILEFFTPEGRISVFARSFQKSKKRSAEIDFFRLLEIDTFQGRKTKSLRSSSTVSVFHGFGESYKATEIGFSWLEKIAKVFHDETPLAEVFNKIVKIFTHFNTNNIGKFDAFFRIKVLVYSGVFKRFDLLQGDVYFDPIHFTFFADKKSGTLKITNLSRQIIEFLRRSDFYEFNEKMDKLLDKNFGEIALVLSEIEKWHE